MGCTSIGRQEIVLSPTLIMKDIEIKDIFCGRFHTLILKNNGELFGMGSNSIGNNTHLF
jgi:alpha-tubulin suppressor-like RCC1 family protein